MADISMCSGDGCHQKSECYRHTANQGFRQSFFSKPPNDGLSCEYFWKNDDYEN